MSEVIFNEQTEVRKLKQRKRPSSAIESLLIRSGIAKSAAGARLVLIAFLVIAVISLFVILYLQKSPGNSYGNYDEFIKQHPELVF